MIVGEIPSAYRVELAYREMNYFSVLTKLKHFLKNSKTITGYDRHIKSKKNKNNEHKGEYRHG